MIRMAELPSGTVTLLFTDIEGSTRMLQALGEDVYVARSRTIDACSAMRSSSTVASRWRCRATPSTSPSPTRPPRCRRPPTRSGARERRLGARAGPGADRDPHGQAARHRQPVRRPRRAPRRPGDERRTRRPGARLRHDVRARAARGRDVLVLRDLGEHRLKDLSAPQRLFQLGEVDFPPLNSLYQTNLPVPATPFLGRERELQEVTALLADDWTRC